MTSDSGGVSKMEEREILSASPIKKTDELETPMILTMPTCKPLLMTVKFMTIRRLSFYWGNV